MNMAMEMVEAIIPARNGENVVGLVVLECLPL